MSHRLIARLCMISHAANIGIVFLIAALSAGFPEYRNLLDRAGRESGFFEMGSLVRLLIISAYCLYMPYNLFFAKNKVIPIRIPVSLLCIGILSLPGAMKEITWGHHLMGFKPPDFFWRTVRNSRHMLHWSLIVCAAVFFYDQSWDFSL